MTEPTPAGEQPPTAPDGTPLTPEEWDAVRRLRGERATLPSPAPSPAPPPAPAVAPEPVEPDAAVDARATGPHEPEAAAEALPAAPQPEADALPAAPRWGGDRAATLAAGSPASRAAVTALGLLLVLAVAAAALVAVVATHLSSKHAATADATGAIAAATDGVATVLSYNYKSLDNDFTKAESLLTPSFRKSYVATTAKAVQPLAAKYKAVSSAQVTAAGVVASGSGHVQVLVFVDQTVTNSQLAKPRLDRSRIIVDLSSRNGHWLINKLTPV